MKYEDDMLLPKLPAGLFNDGPSYCLELAHCLKQFKSLISIWTLCQCQWHCLALQALVLIFACAFFAAQALDSRFTNSETGQSPTLDDAFQTASLPAMTYVDL